MYTELCNKFFGLHLLLLQFFTNSQLINSWRPRSYQNGWQNIKLYPWSHYKRYVVTLARTRTKNSYFFFNFLIFFWFLLYANVINIKNFNSKSMSSNRKYKEKVKKEILKNIKLDSYLRNTTWELILWHIWNWKIFDRNLRNRRMQNTAL